MISPERQAQILRLYHVACRAARSGLQHLLAVPAHKKSALNVLADRCHLMERLSPSGIALGCHTLCL